MHQVETLLEETYSTHQRLQHPYLSQSTSLALDKMALESLDLPMLERVSPWVTSQY